MTTRGIGFRARPKHVDFAVLELAEDGEIRLIADDAVVVPRALALPQQLTYVRTTVWDLLDEFGAEVAGIRVVEANSDNRNPARIQLEAVIQEALAGSSVRSLFAGRLSGIASRLPGEHSPTSLKNAVAPHGAFPEVPGWEEFSSERREAILVGWAALEGAA